MKRRIEAKKGVIDRKFDRFYPVGGREREGEEKEKKFRGRVSRVGGASHE